MTKWHKPFIISLLIHGVIFIVLTNTKARRFTVQEAPPIRAYMVSAAPKTKPRPIIEKSINLHSAPPQLRKSAKITPPAENITIKIKESAMLEPLKATNDYKKIDLKLGLKNILNEQQDRFPSTYQLSQTLAQSQQITVPKEHQENAIDPLKIEQKNMQFTVYRLGDKCFKKVSIGAGVMPKNDLPDSYMLGIECTNTKITDTYDRVMSKWLSKK